MLGSTFSVSDYEVVIFDLEDDADAFHGLSFLCRLGRVSWFPDDHNILRGDMNLGTNEIAWGIRGYVVHDLG